MKPSSRTVRAKPPRLSAADAALLDEVYERLRSVRRRYLGYPSNHSTDWTRLGRFLEFCINNIGDPFIPNPFHLHVRDLERQVLEFFGEITHAPAEDFWGYVTAGGTEGNMYGLYLARELLPGGIVYFSEDTHYSVSKNLRVLGMRHIMIKSEPRGQMDLEDLEETIRIHRDVPPIILANVGTTMKEAVDDLPAIRAVLARLAITRSYIHCDAALSGMILPFVPGAPGFDFAAGADSIAISGHKMLGSPIPCGVALARKSNVDRIARSIEYIGTLDTTLSGSRAGFASLILWYAVRLYGRKGWRRIVQGCLRTAEYAERRLCAVGLAAWRHPHAVTVVFPVPALEVVAKWQLATSGGLAHLITMPHITKAMVDELARDISQGLGPARRTIADDQETRA